MTHARRVPESRLACLVETLGPETDATNRPSLCGRFLCGDAPLGRVRRPPNAGYDAQNSGRTGVGFPRFGVTGGGWDRVIHW